MTASNITKGNKGASKGAQRIAQNLKVAQAQREQILGAVHARVATYTEANAKPPVEWARIEKAINDESFVKSLSMLNGALDIDALCANVRSTTKGPNYVQAKTVEKTVRMVHAFALRDLSKLDNYQAQVIGVSLFNGGALSLTGAQASLSRRVAYDQGREQIKSRAGYTVGTASSQASQVREVLRVLGLAVVNKGKRDDTFTVNEARAQVLREVFALDAETESESE